MGAEGEGRVGSEGRDRARKKGVREKRKTVWKHASVEVREGRKGSSGREKGGRVEKERKTETSGGEERK